MRIGIYLHQRIATDGGAFTFQGSLLEGLSACKTQHELFVLHNEAVDPPALAEMGLRAISLRSVEPTHVPHTSVPSKAGLLRRAARKAKRLLRASTGLPTQTPASTVVPRPPFSIAAERQGLDLVWYPDPASLRIDVDLPFFITVWDLEHRKQPFFPEVSVSGWTWDQRESHYARVLPRAATIFTGTHEGRDEVIRFYQIDPQRVIVNPFAAPRYQSSAQATAKPATMEALGVGNSYLLYPAQFWPHKNHVNLLHAMQVLRQHHGQDINLVLTGSDMGNREHVHQTVNQLGLQDRVHFAGFVSAEELRALYVHAQALVFPSLFGPDNLPPLEAFALGCPVVASNIPGAAQQLEDAALLFDPLDPSDIAAKLAEVLQNPISRARLVERGQAVVARRTAERHVATMLEAADQFAMARRNWGTEYRHT